MKKKITKCLICKQGLAPTANKLITACPKEERYVKFLNKKVEYGHSIVFENKDTTIINLDIPPYSFHIIDNAELKQTRIIKMYGYEYNYEPNYNKLRTSFGNETIYYENLLTLPRAIQCDWTSLKEVEQMVKTFMLFS